MLVTMQAQGSETVVDTKPSLWTRNHQLLVTMQAQGSEACRRALDGMRVQFQRCVEEKQVTELILYRGILAVQGRALQREHVQVSHAI